MVARGPQYARLCRRFGQPGDRAWSGDRSRVARAVSRSRPGARRRARPLGDPDRGVGQAVGLDAERRVRHPQSRASRSGSDRDARRLGSRPRSCACCRDRGGRLEDHAVHGPSHPRGTADAPPGLLRSGAGGRRASRQGLLPRHAAALVARARRRHRLPRAGRSASLRPRLRAHGEFHQHHVDFRVRTPAAYRLPGYRLRLRRLDARLSDGRSRGDRLSAPRAAASRETA